MTTVDGPAPAAGVRPGPRRAAVRLARAAIVAAINLVSEYVNRDQVYLKCPGPLGRASKGEPSSWRDRSRTDGGSAMSWSPAAERTSDATAWE
jgi:hypothetical protein